MKEKKGQEKNPFEWQEAVGKCSAENESQLRCYFIMTYIVLIHSILQACHFQGREYIVFGYVLPKAFPAETLHHLHLRTQTMLQMSVNTYLESDSYN